VARPRARRNGVGRARHFPSSGTSRQRRLRYSLCDGPCPPGNILFPDQRLGKFSRNSVANITRNVRKIFMLLLTQLSRFYRTFRFAI
jgi:hypothetical protein